MCEVRSSSVIETVRERRRGVEVRNWEELEVTGDNKEMMRKGADNTLVR